MPHYYLIYGIGAMSIALGFVALLLQKTYIQSADGRFTYVELPFLGKMRTNYPALVFAFLGAFILAYGMYRLLPPRKVDWVVTGSLETWGYKPLDFSRTAITLIPWDMTPPDVRPDGRYTIHLKLPEGETFERIVKEVYFSHPLASGELFPELEAARPKGESKLDQKTSVTRKYKSVPMQIFPEQ